MASRARLAALAAALLLAGCLPAAPISAPPPSTEAAPTPAPAATMTPAPAMSFPEIVIVPATGGVQVVGLARNDSSLPLRDVSLAIDLLDDDGESLGKLVAALLLSSVQPGALSPFRAAVPEGLSPASTRVTLDGYRVGTRVPFIVALESASTAASADGTRLLGLVRNEGPQAIQIRELAVVWRDGGGSLAGAGLAAIPHAPVPSDANLPWTALAPGAVEVGEVDVFAAATALLPNTEVLLEVSVDPAWRRTVQGRGYVTGEIRNVSAIPLLPAVAVTLWAQGELVGLEILRSTVPLPPGEVLAYGAETFPSLDARLERLGVAVQEVVPSVVVSASAAPAFSEPRLEITVLHFEVIGSRVYLEGTLTRGGEQPLAGAEIHAALRSVEGELQSATWLPIAPGSAGAPVPFRLDLPLPAGVNSALSEIDLRAVGLPFSP
ncbi:MAG: hypothetical protein FJZ97_04360 [Chloroflexi bacterium]|nr:hypothetical protein [Chloroflexota bacterium]